MNIFDELVLSRSGHFLETTSVVLVYFSNSTTRASTLLL